MRIMILISGMLLLAGAAAAQEVSAPTGAGNAAHTGGVATSDSKVIEESPEARRQRIEWHQARIEKIIQENRNRRASGGNDASSDATTSHSAKLDGSGHSQGLPDDSETTREKQIRQHQERIRGIIDENRRRMQQ